jgi:hypothetical protein
MPGCTVIPVVCRHALVNALPDMAATPGGEQGARAPNAAFRLKDHTNMSGYIRIVLSGYCRHTGSSSNVV